MAMYLIYQNIFKEKSTDIGVEHKLVGNFTSPAGVEGFINKNINTKKLCRSVIEGSSLVYGYPCIYEIYQVRYFTKINGSLEPKEEKIYESNLLYQYQFLDGIINLAKRSAISLVGMIIVSAIVIYLNKACTYLFK